MVVEEMNILTTVFLRFDNQKIIYPNSVLSTKPISNYYRSPDMGDAIDFCIHISTPLEKIALMKERILRYAQLFLFLFLSYFVVESAQTNAKLLEKLLYLVLIKQNILEKRTKLTNVFISFCFSTLALAPIP